MSSIDPKSSNLDGAVPASVGAGILQQRTQISDHRRAHQKSIDATDDQPNYHHPYSIQSSVVTHKPRQDSLGGSFLMMSTDSSPNTSFTTGQHTVRNQSNGIVSGAARTGGMTHSHSSSSSGRWNAAHNARDQAYPSSSSPPMTSGAMDGRNAALEEFSDDSISSAFGSPTARPRPSTRGAKLGMQLAKQRSSASQAADQAVAPSEDAAVTSLRPTEHAKEREVVTEGDRLHPLAEANIANENTVSRKISDPVRSDKSPDPVVDSTTAPLSDMTIASLGATPGVDPASLLNADGQPLSSKNILTIALRKAQSAVLLDSSNNVSEAILAYKQAVRLLQEVMDRVSPKIGSTRSSSRRQNREEERRRLKVIYETYAERIRLLSMIYAPSDTEDLADASTAAVGEVSATSFEIIGDQTADTSQSVMAESEIADRLALVNEDDSLVIEEKMLSYDGAPPAPAINVHMDENERLSPNTLIPREELRTPVTPYFEIDPMLGMKGEASEAREGGSDRHGRRAAPSLGLDQELLGAGLAPQRSVGPSNGPLLVSPTVAEGSILQRRKSSVSIVPAFGGDAEPESLSTPTLASIRLAPPDPPSQSSDHLATPMPSSLPDVAREEEAPASSSSSGRKRAISTPGQRRPGIPASFLMNRANEEVAPPLPISTHPAASGSSSSSSQGPMKVRRKASMPLNLIPAAANRTQLNVGTSIDKNGTTSPTPSSYSGYHVLGTPMSGVPMQLAQMGERRNLVDTLFPSPLPSMQLGAPPSFTSSSAALGLPWLGITNALPDTSTLPWPPSDRSMRPFHTMRQLQLSMERGAFVTRRLYIDREVWLQTGIRLHAFDTKVRSAEALNTLLESVAAAGTFLLHPDDTNWPSSGALAIHAAGFLRRLDELETTMADVRLTLSKKLGHVDSVTNAAVNVSPSAGGQRSYSPSSQTNSPANAVNSKEYGGTVKRSNMNTLNSLSSKLQRSLNHMVTHNSKANQSDSTVPYVESLSRLFARAQVIAEHLRSLAGRKAVQTNRGYAALSDDVRTQIEQRLLRASEFMANVVLRFVLRDAATLVDKSLKRSAGLLIE